MIDEDRALRALLDPLVPVEETVREWEDALRRAARLAERDSPRLTSTVAGTGAAARRPRLALRRLLVGLAAAAALAVLALAAAAFWPGGSARGGLLGRALAAVGMEPVIHVVYRDEMHEALVDLATGRQTPLYEQHEQWYEAGRGEREVDSFDGKVQDEVVRPPEHVPPQEQQTYAGILDGYRQALQDGRASIAGRGTIAGHHVYWIAFKGKRLYDVGDHRYHDWSHEVAIDSSSFEPLYVRETLDGAPSPGTGQEILSVETLPEGSVDFTPTPAPQPGGPFVLGASDAVDITSTLTSGAAARVLGRNPVWLGESYHGLQLAFAQTQKLVFGPERSPDRARGVELCYGRATTGPPEPAAPGKFCDLEAPHVLLQESTDPNAYERDIVDAVPVPAGSLLVEWGGQQGSLARDGVHIRISADSQDDLVAAARALQLLRR